MDTFFHENFIENQQIILNKDESFHLTVVLRKQAGQAVALIDGNGKMATADIMIADKNGSMLRILTIAETAQVNFHTLAIAPTKNIDRFEYFVEKAVEVGIHSIIPMFTKNTERKIINEERLKKIILSAAKQSKDYFIPSLSPIQKFENIIQSNEYDQKLLAACKGDTKPFREIYSPRKKSIIFVGPEGDFTDQEMELAKMHHVQFVSLGEIGRAHV